MKLFEFEKHFPDEESCRNKFKEMRDKEGVICLNAEVKSMFGCPATNNTNANNAGIASACVQEQSCTHLNCLSAVGL